MFKSNKAITLIALIITIIVLLILAGVTINMVLGENGLFNKAKTSVAKYENAQERENSTLGLYENEIDSYINGNRESSIFDTTNILWTNPNPTSNFSETETISLDLSSYYGVIIICKSHKDYNMTYPTILNIQKVHSVKPSDYETDQYSMVYGQGTSSWRRCYTLKNGIYFTHRTGGDNGYCIPLYVYGTNNKELVDFVYQGYGE